MAQPPVPPYYLETGLEAGIRGFMINIMKVRGLRFMVNPNVIEHEKSPHYEIEPLTGWPAPLIHYKYGGEYRIKFDLFSDATNAAVDNGLITALFPLFGTQGVKAVLEEFIKPQESLGFEIPITNPFADDEPARRLYPPPDCYLLLGLRWYRTKLVAAPVREVLFDKVFTPVRMFSKLEFIVIEEGVLHDIREIERDVFATTETAQGAAEAIGDLIKIF